MALVKRNNEMETDNGFMGREEREAYDKECHFPDPPAIDKGLPMAFVPGRDEELYSRNMVMGATFTRPLDEPKLIGNSNVLVVGSTGTGKGYSVIKPNVLQMNASYIITDPSGEMARSIGKVLKDHGYKIRILNLCDMEHSTRYNPLAYVKDEYDVRELVDAVIRMTSREVPGTEAPDNKFFTDAERLLLSAFIFYMKDYGDKEDARLAREGYPGKIKNFAGIMDMLKATSINAGTAEVNPGAKSPVDMVFDKLPHDSQAWKYYTAFKQASGKTLKPIIISCITRLQPFLSPPVAGLTSGDGMHLEKLGDEKTAIFLAIPPADHTYNFLASLLYTQAISALYRHAEERKAETGKNRLAVPVRLMMDEFPNLPVVPMLETKMSTLRHYNISATACIQSLSQLKQMFPGDNWRTFIGNCFSIIFLGSSNPEDLQYFADMLGYRCIDINGGKWVVKEKAERPFITVDDLARMPMDECIIFTQNHSPARDKKYRYGQHPYYPQTGDADKANIFAYEDMPEYNVQAMKMADMNGHIGIVCMQDPIQALGCDDDVARLVDMIIEATSKGESSEGEQFFINAEKCLMSACFFYMKDFCKYDEEKNISGVIHMIESLDTDKEDADGGTALDRIFDKLPQDSQAWKYYQAFRQGAGQTLKPIVISCVTRLQANIVLHR